MSNRYLGVRGAVGHVTPFLVLRCAVLLAALMWLLPVCVHSSGESLRVPATSSQGSVQTALGSAAGHECPDTEHGPGDSHCRSAEAVTSTSVALPSFQAADVTAAVRTQGSPPPRAAPGVLVHTPGIHHLQVQRI
ncbi:hypothetical protein [Streptomyces sp. P17]|uniref:hypothetical protein n=1 Tax=Streptomyces sp. P17 TaxID=3074716 RepID=UPI0028F433D5|nr:hypothetical protein [Streptomyces sp. P17]MDT9698382.1 hypothetical protein [Streptomyces sp. P17]